MRYPVAVNFIVMVIIDSSQVLANISTKPYLYFVDASKTLIYTEDLEQVYGKPSVRFLYLNLKTYHYIDYVDLTTPEYSNVSLQLEATGLYWNCKGTSKKYECKNFATSVIIIGLTTPIMKLEIYGHETHFYSYAGCYESKIFEKLEHSDKFSDCGTSCKTTFYGFNPEEKCVCIDKLPKISSAGLEFCSVECPNKKYFFCGGPNYISVYSKTSVQSLRKNTVTTYLNCLVTRSGCPICEQGREGTYCEFIDCSVNNGNCGKRKCEILNLKSYIQVGICHCGTGFFYDSKVICQAEAVSFSPGMENILLIVISFLISAILCSIYILFFKKK